MLIATGHLAAQEVDVPNARELPAAEMSAANVQLFRRYCFDCHDAASREGSIDLENLSPLVSRDIPTAEVWQKVLNAINSGEMPPADAEQISVRDKTQFLRELSQEMVTARKVLSDSGGVITLRRLNRREYANTIESLLGVRPDVSGFPDDQATSGFDTSGASLFFSSDQLEQYLATARASLRLALQPRSNHSARTRRVEPELEYNPHYAKAAAEIRDSMDRAAAYFAQDEKPPEAFGFLDEYQVKRQLQSDWLAQLEMYLKRPETKTGITLIMTIKQGGYTKVKLPALGEREPGRYMIRVRAGSYDDASERLHYLEFSSGYGSGRKRLGWRKVTAPLGEPQIIEFSFDHAVGEKQQIWVHQRSHQDRGDKNLATLDMRKNGYGTPPGIWIDWVELVGPLETDVAARANAKDTLLTGAPASSHAISARDQLLLPAQADVSDRERAAEILNRFATRAFRGATFNETMLSSLLGHYDRNVEKGLSHEDALIDPMAIVLSSPSFLYLVEASGNADQKDLSGPELASRLSYLVWSCPPDAELMDLAMSGELLKSDVLRRQTNRLLRDERANRFVTGFVHQWLSMDRLDMFQFDARQFRTFDNAVRHAARQEIFETFRLVQAEALPLQTLLNADFVVINDLLAGYYGIDGVEGHEFRKVRLPRNSLRGGLLGTAAVLAMGSDGRRSSPVERGAWILRHLIHDAPPPAPPNVPQLSRLDGEILSARQLQQAHQEQPQCAQCHQKIDPLGFGLENFDASGLWREKETVSVGRLKSNRTKSFPIDPSGTMPDGKKFHDYFGLRSAVASYRKPFATGFAESLIAYALGRPYGFTDQDLVDDMMASAQEHNFAIDAFVHALVQSQAFRER